MEAIDHTSTARLFRLVVNFVYEELLSQFLNNNGECKESTFLLINWTSIIENSNDGLYGKLEKKIIYKCYISYLVNLFSQYLKTRDTCVIKRIQKILYDENLLFSNPFSFSITNEIKKSCLKIVSFCFLIEYRIINRYSLIIIIDGLFS